MSHDNDKAFAEEKLKGCSEPVEGNHVSVACPNDAVGYFRDGEVYEMRKYPMCAFHASRYGHKVDERQCTLDREAAERALKSALAKLASEVIGEMIGD